MKINFRLKELRVKSHITQCELAKHLNTTQSTLCKWEKGTLKPKISHLIKITKFFNVRADYLLGLED